MIWVVTTIALMLFCVCIGWMEAQNRRWEALQSSRLSLMDPEIGVMDSEIGVMDSEIGLLDVEDPQTNGVAHNPPDAG